MYILLIIIIIIIMIIIIIIIMTIIRIRSALICLRGSRARRKPFCDFKNIDIDVETQEGAIM